MCRHADSPKAFRGATTSTINSLVNRRGPMEFSEDVVPLSDLKLNPGRVVQHANEVHRPVLLTRRGRGVAVVQSVVDY